MQIAIYSRASTEEQTIEQQLKELRTYCRKNKWKHIHEFTDEGISALKRNRPGFLKLMEAARKKKIDLILVWKLDRFSRSLKELVETMDFLDRCNVKFVSYTQAFLDTTTPSGKLMFGVFSSIAEFERDLISERTKLKLRYLKEKGVKLGRPRKIDYKRVELLRKEGLSLKQIGDKFGVEKNTISKAVKVIREGTAKHELKSN